MPINYGKRLPVDPRVVDRIQRSPQMMAEQGGAFLQSWGGPQMYQKGAKLPVNQRVVYHAVESGLRTPEEISPAVDLSIKDVESALSQLEKKGLVSLEAAP